MALSGVTGPVLCTTVTVELSCGYHGYTGTKSDP